MSEAKLQKELYDRFPNLGRLTIGIIEHVVEPVLGKAAISVIAEPYKNHELYLKICEALEKTERRFINDYSNTDIAKGLIHLKLSDLSSIRTYFWEFSKNPTNPEFPDILYKQFCADYPRLEDIKRKEAVSKYVSILKGELIGIDDELRQKISAAALLSIQSNVEKISNTLGSIDKSTKAIADAILQKLPRDLSRTDLPIVPQTSNGKYRKYLELLQSSILEVFRQDQHVLLSVETLATEDPSTLHTLQQALRSAYGIQVEDVRGKRTVPENIEEIVPAHRLIVLLGDPGIGKTTSLRYLALRQAEKALAGQSDLLPIWVSLSQWVDLGVPAREFIWEELNKLTDGKKLISRHDFDRLLKDGKTILFLDGLNEIPHRQQDQQELPPEARDKKSSEAKIIDIRENSLTTFAREVQSQFIISCRILEYTHLPGWWEYRVLPLNDQQAFDLVEKYLGIESRQLQLILDRQPDLKEFTRNAFYLRSLIRLVQEDWKEIPADRFELVQFTCWAAMHREARRRGIDPVEYMQLISKISFEAMERGLIGSTVQYPFEPKPNGGEGKKDTQQPDDHVLDEIFRFCESTGLIIRIPGDDEKRISFRYQHQLIQEALALICLKNQITENDISPEISSMIQLGRIHFYWGKLKEAQENFEKALSLCSEIGLKELRMISLVYLSRIYRYWRQSKMALNYAEKAVELADMKKPSRLLASVCHELGSVYHRLWRLKESENYYLQSLEIYRILEDKSNYAYEIVYGVADFYASPRVYQCSKALSLYDKALKVFEELDDKHGIAISNLEKASTLRLLGEMSEAEELFQKCMADFDQLNEKRQLQEATERLGYLYRDWRRFDNALPLLEDAYQLSRELGDITSQISILMYGLAWVNSYQNKHKVALDHVDNALKLAKQLSEPYWLADVYIGGYVQVCWRARRYDGAYDAVHKFQKYADEEYDVSFGDMLFIKWASIVGSSIERNALKKTVTDILRFIQSGYHELNNPSHWFGRQIWRISWRINNLRNWTTSRNLEA